jgi:MFS transporter, PAT family, beta-lactamase induction signal transducer AmpG
LAWSSSFQPDCCAGVDSLHTSSITNAPSSTETENTAQAPAGLRGLLHALTSWRTAAVVLLSFSSGLPLGLVWLAIPDWMRDIGVDIRIVGLVTLAQAPWAFKVLWSPLMDRYVPPFWGRRRGWMAISQIALFACGLWLAGVGQHPDAIWVVGAVALATGLAAASQDIAIDAYAVDVLRREEQGAASGARTAMYRAAMAISGGAAITAAGHWGWPIVNLMLALFYLPILVLTWKAPEPEVRVQPPVSLRAAVWAPLLELMSRRNALQILAFVVLYKIADQLAQALTRPFLIDMGYNADHRGIALATVGLAGTIVGSLIGGWITTLVGLGHSLWLFGFLQIFSNIGYFFLARTDGPNLPLMYGATSFELFTSGLGTGAFSVLLLRLTEKRFSATQYALLSSLFALPRLAAGPISGFAVHAMGWGAFYLATMVIGIPGLLMLSRFVPLGVRDPDFSGAAIDGTMAGGAVSTSRLATRGLAGGVLVGIASAAILAGLAALQAWSTQPRDAAFAVWRSMVHPASMGDWVQLAGVIAVAVIGGMVVAAATAARGESVP